MILNRVMLGAGIAFVFATQSYAAERTIEEEWVIGDPTVSQSGEWVAGFSGDYTYYDNEWDIDNEKVQVEADRTGASFYIGKGNTTLLVSYKDGDYDFTRNGTFGINSTGVVDLTQYEIRLRHMFPEENVLGATPYVLLGYVNNSADTLETATSGAFSLSGASTLTMDTSMDVLMAGIGGIWTFSDSMGLRADIAVGYSDYDVKIAESTAPNQKISGSGFATVGMATLYKNFDSGFNLQAGLRGEYYEMSENGLGDLGGYGPFIQIGYAHRF